MWNERRACRAAEGAPAPDEEENRKNRPDGVQSMPGKEKERRCTEGLQRVADENHMATVEAVGDVASWEQEEKSRQKEHETWYSRGKARYG